MPAGTPPNGAAASTDAASGLLVSAVIPAHNAEETIVRALESALAQTYRPLEIVVVDDCSSDRTAEIVDSFARCGVRLVRLPEQQGASGARNAGILAAHGELVAFLDADDEWLPSKIAKQVALIAGDGKPVFVTCAARLISVDGEDLGDLYRWRRPLPGTECWKSLLACNTVATPSVLAWRRDLVELGGFDRRYRICEDQDMWIRLALRGSVAYIDECLVRVHNRPNSLSSKSAGHRTRVVLDVIDRHIAEQRPRLSAAEIRAIRGERLAWLGRTECNDDYFQGAPALLRSMLLGYRPLQSALFLIGAAPPARWLKRKLRAQADGRALRLAAPAPPRPAARPRHPMLPRGDDVLVPFPRASRPHLVVIVDAEEQYDWRLPLSRFNTTVRSMAAQGQAQRIYRHFGVVPTYAVDYPIVAQEAGYRPVMEMLEAGECELGAQLHAWVTPPHEEEVCERHSFACNLPGDLERRKLEALVEAIERRFGMRPRLYRAGRYGTGGNTAAILERLGFDVDCSVVPEGHWNSPDAPDYSGGTARPYWLQAARPILEIPVTAGTVGIARGLGDEFYRRIKSNEAVRLRLPGILARTGLLNRIRLSPEGNTIEESKQLTRRLVADGHRVFAVSYHSPSLEPGNTPYVRNQADLDRFLNWIERYLEFFFTEMNGVADTPCGVHNWAAALSRPAGLRPSAGSEAAAAVAGASLQQVG
jgi:glycosyltransferase involved in cell wall biosynthesis